MDKGSDEMSSAESNLFWKLTYFLVVEQDYQMIRLFEDRQEIFLENLSNKSAQLIRIIQEDLTWGNRLRRDIQRVSAQGESVRKQLGKRNLTVLNIYLSPHPPVDDYERHMKAPFYFPKGKRTKVTSILYSQDQTVQARHQLDRFFPGKLAPDFFEACSDGEAAAYQRAVVAYSIKKNKEDKQLFNYAAPFFSYLFIGIQVAVFLLMELSGGSTNYATLIQFGAKYNPLILEGEWWRFFTPMFLHIGLLHLLMNTVTLYVLGTVVERIYGRLRFLFLYIFAGFAGTLASFLTNMNLSAGASGAIFGCFGALLYFGMMHRRQFFRTMGMNVIFIIIINLVFGFTVPGIDNAGHIGGLIGGFLAAGTVHLPKQGRRGQQLAFLAAAVGITAGVLYLGFHQ
ncbi:rhomboid family intramembrane serine protease [Bacillus xiapuensis]|uniref:rhomboid family intramembrane serine protease n=1 Tax=Bacillus xiapuensis TaxID=2014075 RepID=UPI001E4EDDE9|nr:rhomboid family intramembrane serine protease [Bacillus xiapuensis]